MRRCRLLQPVTPTWSRSPRQHLHLLSEELDLRPSCETLSYWSPTYICSPSMLDLHHALREPDLHLVPREKPGPTPCPAGARSYTCPANLLPAVNRRRHSGCPCTLRMVTHRPRAVILPDFETAVQGSLAASVEIRFAAARQRKRSTPSHIEDIAWTTVLNPALEPSTLASRPLDFDVLDQTTHVEPAPPLVA